MFGEYIVEYNSISQIARMILADYFKGVHTFDYLENYPVVTIEYANQVIKETFREENMVLSVIKGER